MLEKSFPERLRTERLILRRYRLEDSSGVLMLINQNREGLVREFAQMAALRTSEDVASFLSEKREQWNEGKTFCYGIWDDEQGSQVGQIQVKNIAWEIPAAELGYFIDEAWQRRGYAAEAIRAVLEFAFQELAFERIFVRILPSNSASLRLAQKLGFLPEGLHRRAYRCGFGELHDVQYLGIIRDDYRTFHP